MSIKMFVYFLALLSLAKFSFHKYNFHKKELIIENSKRDDI